ncbi:MAG: ArsR family transcriptional regulator [Candidatus Altiarchaeota archaeon]
MTIRVTIRGVEKPFEKDIQNDLDWLCSCLGFCSETQQKTASQVFKELIGEISNGRKPSSTELSSEVGMSRGAVIHQLNRLAQAGLIRKEGRTYVLRGGSVYRTIKEVERDIMRVFEDLGAIALEIDEQLGFKRRA